jgi:predicted dehydrogenase
MMNGRLKVAVVGAGISNSQDGRERWAVRAHLPALRALPDLYEVVAVCTTRMETAKSTARHFGVPHAFDNVERMLKELPEIDVVCVSVRPVYHHPVVMTALSAGKHVYCEQPLGISTAQAQELYELARKKGVRTLLGHQTHYEPASLQMAELVQQGYIGKPLACNYTYFVSNHIVPRPSHRQWVFQAKMSGRSSFRSGQSLERMIAVLGEDVTDICADMAVKVRERVNLDGGPPIISDQVDNLNYLLRFGHDIMATMQVSITAWFGTGARFEIYGDEGMLMLTTGDSPQWDKKTGQGDPSRGELILYGARADLEQIIKNPTAPERLQRQFGRIPVSDRHYSVTGIEHGRATFLVAQAWYAFAQAIKTGKDCAPSFRDQLKIHYVWDAAERSVRERCWAKVDYGRLDFPNDR